jgi:flagellar protein FliS
MTAPNLRNRYLEDSIATASPGKLLVMLYDRLVLDLMQAEEAFRKDEREAAGERLNHAQEIVLELRTTLKVDAWDGAAGLAALYSFLLTELIQANIRRDIEKVASCRSIIEPLRDAWREAVAAPAAGPAHVG